MGVRSNAAPQQRCSSVQVEKERMAVLDWHSIIHRTVICVSKKYEQADSSVICCCINTCKLLTCTQILWCAWSKYTSAGSMQLFCSYLKPAVHVSSFVSLCIHGQQPCDVVESCWSFAADSVCSSAFYLRVWLVICVLSTPSASSILEVPVHILVKPALQLLSPQGRRK